MSKKDFMGKAALVAAGFGLAKILETEKAKEIIDKAKKSGRRIKAAVEEGYDKAKDELSKEVEVPEKPQPSGERIIPEVDDK